MAQWFQHMLQGSTGRRGDRPPSAAGRLGGITPLYVSFSDKGDPMPLGSRGIRNPEDARWGWGWGGEAERDARG